MKAYCRISSLLFFLLGLAAVLCENAFAVFIGGLGAVLFHVLAEEIGMDQLLKEMEK